MKGAIRSLDPCGHGIIRADDGSRFPFLFIDVLSRHALVIGRRVVFAIRRVKDKPFAENISLETDRLGNSRSSRSQFDTTDLEKAPTNGGQGATQPGFSDSRGRETDLKGEE